MKLVAPHAGSVDRNDYTPTEEELAQMVAPHAGSVDRNVNKVIPSSYKLALSLPTRGAWIEIIIQ